MAEPSAASGRQDDDVTVTDKILAAITGFGEQILHFGNRLDKLESRKDADEESEDEKKRKREEEERGDARKRHDAFSHFSARKADDTDDSYKDRHDAEEKALSERYEKEGDPKETAADRAKRGRKDAEMVEKDARDCFTDRKDDEDEKVVRDRRDAEEKSLRERLEKEGEKRNDSVLRAHWGRSRKDALDKDRMDKARKDARTDSQPAIDLAAIRSQLRTEVLADIGKLEPSEDDRAKLAEAQSRCDAIAQAFGEQAPRPMRGELLHEYQRRVLKKYQMHSKDWKDVDLSKLHVDALGVAERRIYADASDAARSPTASPGQLRSSRRTDVTGRQITEFYGEPLAWMREFMPPKQMVQDFRTPKVGG